jgi:hypothetical protein
MKDLKMEAMHKTEDNKKQFKLQEDNDGLEEELKNKGDQWCKMQSLNESLIKEITNLKLENYELGEELKNKYEEIKGYIMIIKNSLRMLRR